MKDVKVYIGKDNRVRYYYKDDNGIKHLGSYPRILMEQKLGRPLKPEEDVHHMDENPLNNDINNLEIRIHGEHQSMHASKYFDTIEVCIVCGKLFTYDKKQWSDFFNTGKRKPRYLTCSKSCAGKLSSGKYPKLYNIDSRIEKVKDAFK